METLLKKLVEFMVTQGLALIVKAKQAWVAEGKSPDEFDQMVAEARAEREKLIDWDRERELAKLRPQPPTLAPRYGAGIPR